MMSDIDISPEAVERLAAHLDGNKWPRTAAVLRALSAKRTKVERERDEHLEASAKYLYDLTNTDAALAAERERVRVLEEALRWYAGDGSTYDGFNVGQRARTALGGTP